MIFGLTATEAIKTGLGDKKGMMIRFKDCVPTGAKDEAGNDEYEILFQFYENRAKYLDGDSPLQTRDINKRVRVCVPPGTDMEDETIIHQTLKTPLAEVYTLADENT